MSLERVGWVLGKGAQSEVGYTFLLGLFGVAVSTKSASHKSRYA